MFLTSLVSSMPSTMMWPFWCSSSRLMQRIMVDLPEPEGPHDHDPLALPDVQIDVAQHMKLAEPLVPTPSQHDDRRVAAVVAGVITAMPQQRRPLLSLRSR